MAHCVKDSGQVRSHGQHVETSHWSAGGRTRFVESWRGSLSGPADTLSSSRHLSLCWGAGGHVVPVWRCVCLCVNICVWEGREQTMIHYTPAGFAPSSSVVSPNEAKYTYTPTQTHKCTLLSCSIQSVTLLCWHAVESPPNLFTRTTLCYCQWKGLEQFRKYPTTGLGMIGMECKCLWSHLPCLRMTEWKYEVTWWGWSLLWLMRSSQWTWVNHRITQGRKRTLKLNATCMLLLIKMHSNRFALSLPLPGIHNQQKLLPPPNKWEKKVPQQAVLSDSILITRTCIYILWWCEGER